MSFLSNLKALLIGALSLVLATVWAVLSVTSRRRKKLEEAVHQYEIKEEADAFRAEPVAHDKRDILDRM